MAQTKHKPTVTVFTPKEWITLWNVEESRYHAALTADGEAEEHIHRTNQADLEAMLLEFNEEERVLVVYREHFNRNPDKETDALGYVVAMRLQGSELQGRFNWTRLGLDLVVNGLLRYLSPEMAVELRGSEGGLKVISPTRMLSVGLTNMPANRTLPPISEAEGEAALIFAHRDAGSQGVVLPATNPTNNNMLQRLIALLGLAATASEAEVFSAVEALNLTCQAAAQEAEDAFISTNRAAISAAAEPHWRSAFRANPGAARAMIPAPAAAPASTAVFRNANLGTPTPPASPAPANPEEVAEDARTPAQHAAVFNAIKQGKQRSSYFRRHEEAIRSVS